MSQSISKPLEKFIAFFEGMSNGQKFGWVLICLSLFWLVEFAIPLVSFGYKKWRHARTNLVLLVFTILINTIFGIATVGVFIWMDNQNFGLLNVIKLPIWLELLTSLMILDLVAQYIVHVLLHKYKFMWKLHLVHHSDTAIDVTTGTRLHPGDYVFREIFGLIAILVGGISFPFYIFYKITTVFFTYFSHANIQLPAVLDKTLSYVFVTPNMHKFHHHFERPWTNTNYGNIFSIWDRIFGTFVYDDTRKIRYGVDVLEDSTSDNLVYQLKVPFDRSIKTDY